MTVIRPNSISGITSLTAHRGSIDFYAHDGSAATFTNINSNVTSGVSTFASLNITGDLDVGGALTYEDVTNVDSVGVVTARDIIFSGSTGTAGQFVLRRDSDGANIGQFRSDVGTNDISIGNGGSGSLILKTGANTERLRITSAGNVGIDNTTPHRQLVVANGGDIACFGANGGIYFGTSTGGFRNNGAIARAQQAGYHVSGSQVGDLVMAPEADKALIFSSGGTSTMYERLRLTTGGNIGINDSGPNFHLDVNGNIALREGQVLTWHDGSGNKAGDIYMDSSDNFVFRNTSSVTERLRITSDGAIAVGNASQMGSNYARISIDCQGRDVLTDVTDITKYGLAFHNDPNTNDANGIGFFNDDGTNCGGYILHQDKGSNNLGDLIFGTSATSNNPIERLRITSDGNMGLGVTPIAPGNTALHIGETTSGDPVRLHMTTANTGHTVSDGFTLSIDGSSSAVNLIQRENAAIQIYTNNTSRVSVDNSGMTVNNGYRISTNAAGSTSLPNPYSLGALASATIPSYPHFTGTWLVMGSVPCNNTWYDLLHSFSDSNGLFHGYSGDASSKNIFQYQYSMTSPAYGVNILSQRFMNGAWNTGSVSFQIRNNSGAWTLQIKATSHYNSSNNAGFRIMFHSYY